MPRKFAEQCDGMIQTSHDFWELHKDKIGEIGTFVTYIALDVVPAKIGAVSEKISELMRKDGDVQ